MSAPRQIIPGVTYLLTRRCAQRQFLLRPSAASNAILKFVLAVAAQRSGIQLHAFCVMSNHLHLVLTDPYGRLPAFAQFLASLVARATNSTLGRWEAFWAPNSYSAVRLLTPSDVVAKIAYVLGNPVSAGLVRHGREWPGLWSAPESIGEPAIQIDRPGVFFRPGGSMPETATLRLVRPAGFISEAEFDRQLADALGALEADAAEKLAVKGRTVLGVAGILSQKPTGRPAPGEPRRALSPRIAGRDTWKRKEALGRLKEFVRSYREALADWRRGLRDAIFPEGTYLMRLAHGVCCAG